MALIVQKYGGSSVADAGRIRNVAGRIAATADAGNQVVVVVSAMGKTTDGLIELAGQINQSAREREMNENFICRRSVHSVSRRSFVSQGRRCITVQTSIASAANVNASSML